MRKSKKISYDTIIVRDDYTCIYCGARPEEGAKLHLDHIVPLSQGGTDKAGNLATSCSWCNFRKGSNLLSSKEATRVTETIQYRNSRDGIDNDKEVKLPPRIS